MFTNDKFEIELPEGPELEQIQIYLKEIPPEGKTWDLSRHPDLFHKLFQPCILKNPNDNLCEITLKKLGEKVLAKARIKSSLILECARCLTDVSHTVNLDFDFYFFKENETDPETEETYTYSVNYVDVYRPLYENAQLVIPQKLVCSEACKGLCITCGADLNKRECGCKKTTGNLAFQVLKNLKDQ